MAGSKQTLILVLVVLVFVVVGMFVFSALEGFKNKEAFGLCMQIITTIGYGNHTPSTVGGQVFCIFYTLVGIPLNLVLLQRVGEHILNLQKVLVTRLERRFYHREPRYVNEKCTLMGVLLVLILLFVGAGIVVKRQSWSFLQGVYCYVITFTTVGFGDFIPHSSSDTFMVIFRPLYNYVGLCAMSNVINSAVGLADSVEDFKKLCRRCLGNKERERCNPGDKMESNENDLKQLTGVVNTSVQEY